MSWRYHDHTRRHSERLHLLALCRSHARVWLPLILYLWTPRSAVRIGLFQLFHTRPFDRSPPWVAPSSLVRATAVMARTQSSDVVHVTSNTRPLSERAQEWCRFCLMSKWISDTIQCGHTLHFQSAPPPFNGIVETTFTSQEQSQALELELQELLSMNAISQVPRGQELSGFYSRYFVVPKKSGGMRPILDLSLFHSSDAFPHVNNEASPRIRALRGLVHVD
ncbi:uncharacterized protein [Nothobranchius furzeri]|uniref:uncharacterized protein n=1 Tax=Nothobranchius furzeri TaxID=105023 RepID=UPI0039047211